MPLKPLQMLQHKTRLRPELLLRWIHKPSSAEQAAFLGVCWRMFRGEPGDLSSTIGISWDFIGISWGFHGISWDFIGISWDLLGFHGISWDFMGISLGFHGISWDFIGISWWFHGDFMGFHGIKIGIWIWQFQTGFHGDTIRDILKPGLVN